ncbi:MarR family winged helix-turn-helix transcriptional regulator [Ruegeria atlantica]|uniref:MarR family winged helix-turn-helix transcriptional regulator n=1 Tax=Ruegeria atlantica TaxID=81569 RepID=UPI00147F416E|nr:MarR family transcriptional regulator [Ruegeria atlantica]
MTSGKNACSPAELLYAGVQLTRPLLRNITARVEADLMGTGVSVGQRAILEVLLAVGQATAPEITRLIDVSRQFVGRELKTMLETGMVTATPNPEHRRAHNYALSAKSKKVIETIREREKAEFRSFANQFSDAEIAAYFKIQKALNDSLSSAPENVVGAD